MPIRIEEVNNSDSLDEFIKLPFSIHGQNSLWTPNLIKQDRALLSPGQHPFWLSARRKLFLARSGNEVVGRIAAIVDEKYNNYSGSKCGAFGFFECQNNHEATHMLLEQSRDWLLGQGMTFMRGPLNPSANYSCGLLVSGFQYAPTLMMPWNPPWYAQLLESWKLRKEQDLFAYLIRKDQMELPEWLKNEVERIKSSGNFVCRPSSKKTLKKDIEAMLELYRLSWADNWGFSPLSPQEATEHVKELSTILDPRFFVLFFHEGKPVAGMVAMPDLTPLLKRLNGKIGLSAPWHYWRSRHEMRKGYRIMLFGILPEYRLQGLPLLLLDYMLAQAKTMPDFEWVEGSWVLEDNVAIDDLIEDFGGQLYKRYRIYRREIAPC